MPSKILHTVQVQGLQLEFRAPTAGRTIGSIACISPGGEVEVLTSFHTLESIIEGVIKIREKMREEMTQNDCPPKA